MATVYKHGGKGNREGYYYAAWRDHLGRRHTKCTRTTDKVAAERIAAKYEADAALRRDGVIDSALERYSVEAKRPIAQHVADFKAHLEAQRNTEKHVRTTIAHIIAIVKRAKVATIRDLAGASAMKAIDAIRKAGNRRIKDEDEREPLSLRTCNAHLRSIKPND